MTLKLPGGIVYKDMEINRSGSFAIPVKDKVLIYSPLQGITALTNRNAARILQRCLDTSEPVPSQLQALYQSLIETPRTLPITHRGDGIKPLFLGIIPTRSCNLQCAYCDFLSDQDAGNTMSLAMAKQAIDAYFEILDQEKGCRADIQFFGGEPFHAPEVVYFSAAYGRRKAEQRAFDVHFEVTTNGVFKPEIARWAAEHFDAIILSLDGPSDIQESQRPAKNGKPVFPIVYGNAKIISSGSADLIIRSCVSHKTAHRMAAMAKWIVGEFQPKAVCFESLHPTEQSAEAGLLPPEPIEFASQFHAAAEILEAHGIMAVHSTTDISACRTTICPVGRNALIVSPDGAVDACYLSEKTRKGAGLNLRLGRVRAGKFELDENILESIHGFTSNDHPGCVNCLCRYHCAGGCHVRQNGNHSPGRYADTCVQTRLVTTANLLRRMNAGSLANDWLEDTAALMSFANQSSDQLMDMT